MAALLLFLTGPIVLRVLTTLGLGVVTYTGLTSFLVVIFNEVSTRFNSIPPEYLNLVFLSGIPQGMAIILSALSIRAGLMQVSKIQRIL